MKIKHTLVFLASLFILALLSSSCTSSKKCAAYGETQQYQISNRR